jgi:rubrerythrin
MEHSIDREKVINELVEHIESALAVDSDYVDCVRTDLLQTVVGLLKEYDTHVQYRDDHIAEYEKEIKRLNKLVKEQEPFKPRKKKDKEWGINRWSCGNCGYNVGYPHMAYFCSKCGKPILWEGMKWNA